MSLDDRFKKEYLEIAMQIERNPRPQFIKRLFEMADEKFHPAIHTISVCFERGIVLKQDEQAAFDYCIAAARLKNPAATHNMGCNYFSGKFVEKDTNKALAQFITAANLGYVMPGHCVGFIYDNGANEIQKHGDEAHKAYEWAYRNGYVRSANNLGVFHINGRHTTPNIVAAEEWFRKAIQGGDSAARKNMMKLEDLKRYSPTSNLSQIKTYAKLFLSDNPFGF